MGIQTELQKKLIKLYKSIALDIFHDLKLIESSKWRVGKKLFEGYNQAKEQEPDISKKEFFEEIREELKHHKLATLSNTRLYELMKFYQNSPSLYDNEVVPNSVLPEHYYSDASSYGLSETDAKFGEVHEKAKHLFNQGKLNQSKFRELIKERSNRDRVVSISRKFSEINNDFRTIVKSDYQDVKQEDMQRLFDASLASMQITLKPLIKRAIEQGLKPDPLYVSLAKLMEEENNEWRIF